MPDVSVLEAVLRRHVLAAWFPISLDREYGGFLCDFDRRWRVSGNNEKLLEFQARQTWLAAEASLAHPQDEDLRRAALHGYRFLKEVMWDHRWGGWFHRTSRSGEPMEGGTKHAHGVAYAICASIVVHAAAEESDALKLALTAFEWLDRHSRDRKHGGYIGFLQRDGMAIRDGREVPWARGSDTIGTPIGCKDVNVHTDLLETLIYLYRVNPSPVIEDRLLELLRIVNDRMSHRGGLHTYCRFDWTPVPGRHYHGFPLQAAHRMLAASQVLPGVAGLDGAARRLVDRAFERGVDSRCGGLFATPPSRRFDIEARAKPMWVQTEALWAMVALHRADPDDRVSLERAADIWDYIHRRLLDERYGGFYDRGVESLPFGVHWPNMRLTIAPRRFTRKGHSWKDASHEGRALLRSIDALRNDTGDNWRVFPLDLLPAAVAAGSASEGITP